MNPSTTLFAGLGVSQVADIIHWLSTWPIQAPPENVSLAMAALVVTGAHMAANFLKNRFPTATQTTASVPVEIKPAAAVTVTAAPVAA